jgi:GTP-binding protein
MKIKEAKFIKGIRGTDAILDENLKHIAFFGRSNVGKSSAINSILSRNSLVKSSSKPGKTREINFFKTSFFLNKKGCEEKIKELFFVDLPGYGYAKLSLEQRESLRKMIIWYLSEVKNIEKLNIVVIDAKVGLTDFDKDILYIIEDTGQKAIILLNKIDKLNQKNKKKILDKVTSESVFPVVEFSALKKKGVESFLNKIKDF